MNNKIKCRFITVSLIVFALFKAIPLQSQVLNSTYFMDGASNRIKLNPALRPTQGYVNVPLVGDMNVMVSSNAFGLNQMIDIFKSGTDFYNNDNFYNHLSPMNRLNLSVNTDLISFGFYRGSGFWSFNVGLRADVQGNIPHSVFNYLRQSSQSAFTWDNLSFSIHDQQLSVNAYTEVGAGYSRQIDDHFTLGGRFKLLMGMANMNMNIHQLDLYGSAQNMQASIQSDATIDASMKGLEFENSTDPYGANYISGLDFHNYGIAGYGGAIDLGVNYTLKNFRFSAAITDLGFIRWSKAASTHASALADRSYNANNFQDFINITDNSDVFDFDLINLHAENNKARTTAITSTLVFGAQYIINPQINVGVLSTTRFLPLHTLTEVTLSGNYTPFRWLNASLTYSAVQTQGKTFGLALKLGPVIIGSDYINFSNSFKTMNAYLGISIPLSGPATSWNYPSQY